MTEIQKPFIDGTITSYCSSMGGAMSHIMLMMAVEARKKSLKVMWVDTEMPFDPKWAEAYGLKKESENGSE